MSGVERVSEKFKTIAIDGIDEATDVPVRVSFTIDQIVGPAYVYIWVDGKSYEVSSGDMGTVVSFLRREVGIA